LGLNLAHLPVFLLSCIVHPGHMWGSSALMSGVAVTTWDRYAVPRAASSTIRIVTSKRDQNALPRRSWWAGSISGAAAFAALRAQRMRHSRCCKTRVAGLGSSSESEGSYTIDSHGYAQAPSTDGTGGWLAHRLNIDVPGSGPGADWLLEACQDPEGKLGVDLSTAASFVVPGARLSHRPRILVLYGSLRQRSFSKLLAYECARLLELLGADVRVYSPAGLPVRDPSLEEHPKVQELRSLSLWSEGHVWVSPEMHGCVTGAFKNQIDWLPLNTGSVRPTQGRTCVVLQVNGGSQSFNVVNELRRLARWMRMPCCTNQSSVAKAWQEFDDDGRMKPSGFRDRVVDVIEEYYKFTLIMREHANFLVDRYSERKEIAEKGRLMTQAEKEKEKEKQREDEKEDRRKEEKAGSSTNTGDEAVAEASAAAADSAYSRNSSSPETQR